MDVDRVEYFSREFYEEIEEKFKKSLIYKNAYVVDNYDKTFSLQKEIDGDPDFIACVGKEEKSYIEAYKHLFKDYKGEDYIIFNNFTSEFNLEVIIMIFDGFHWVFPEEFSKKSYLNIIIISDEKFTELYSDVYNSDTGNHFFQNFDGLFLNKDCDYYGLDEE